MKITGIIPAAGLGKRMGSKVKKQFLVLNDLPIVVRTVLVLSRCALIDELILVTGREELDYVGNLVEQYKLKKVKSVVIGGQERQDSVFSGLLQADDADYILVHDGVRPFIREEIIEQVISAGLAFGAAGVAVPVTDTIKQADRFGQFIETTVLRDRLWAMQTPQVFLREVLLKAHLKAQEAGVVGTDDSFLVEKIGVRIKLVPGDYDNLKITTSRDLLLGGLILEERKRQ